MISKMTSFAELVILRNIVIAKLWLCFIKIGSFENNSDYMRGLFTAGSDKLGNQANTILKTHLQQSNRKFCQLGDFTKYSHSKAMAVFYKIVKLVKNGVLMMIHIYAKVSLYGIININKLMLNIKFITEMLT
jgi:viroplasmin and RNaseH domain-containing protein